MSKLVDNENTGKGRNPAADENADAKTLKIALFSGNYNYVMDGPVRALNTLVAFLENQGHKVRVFAPTVKEPAFQHSGTLISAPSVAIPGRDEYRFSLGFSREIKNELAGLEPDLIHLAAPDVLGHSALQYARKNAIPAVASFHTRFDTYPRYYGMKWAERFLTRYMRYFYNRCEHVYAPSKSMADELSAEGMGRDIRLWTRGVDSTIFNPEKRDLEWRRALGFKDDDVVAAFVGRVVLEKGIGVFAETLSRAKGVKALVVGEGPERARFQEKLPEGQFTGYLEGDALARAYASADIFFNPSITETFGNVTLEAMAAGAVPLCANAAGSASLIDDGVTGLLAAPDAESFLPKLELLANDKDLRMDLRRAALNRSRDFSWEKILHGLVDDYRDAIANYRG